MPLAKTKKSPFLLVHVCDLVKSHRKAHFRRDSATGKLIYVHEHDLKDGKGHDLEIAPGDRMRVNNPKSKHHGKELTVTSYSKVYGVSGKIPGEKYAVEMHPDRLEHVKATPAPLLVVRRTPVREIVAKIADKDVEAPVRAPVSVDYDFKKSLDEFLKNNSAFNDSAWRPDVDPGWTRHYFKEGYRDAGFIQVKSSTGEPMLIGRKGDGFPHPTVTDFFRGLRKQYLASIGEKLTFPMAFAEAGIELKSYADGSYTLAGNTYPHREKIAKYKGVWDRTYKRYSLPPAADLLGLVHDLPPYYDGSDLNVEGPSITGKTPVNPAVSGAGDSRLNPDGHDHGTSRPGAPDGRRDSPGSSEGERGLPGEAPKGTRKKILGIETLSVTELTKLIHQKGIKPPKTTVTYDPKRFGAVELRDHQIEGVEQICSAFDEGQCGFLLGDGTGSGKTYTGAGVIAQMGYKNTLVVAPSDGIRDEWVRVLGEMGLPCAKADGTTSDFAKDTGVLIATYATFSQNPTLHAVPRDLVIFDEAHTMKNLANGESGKVAPRGYDCVRMQMRHQKHILYSTATPYERPDQAKIYEALGLWGSGSFDKWVQDRGVSISWRPVPMKKGGTTKVKEYVVSPNNRDKVIRSMLVDHIHMVQAGKYLSREPHPEGVFLYNHFKKRELTPEQMGTYEAIRYMYARLAAKAHPRKRGMLMAQRLLWSRRFLEHVKLDEAIDLAKTRMAEGKKVSIMLGYKSSSDITDQLAKLQGIVKESGGVTTAEFAAFEKMMKGLGIQLDGAMDKLKKAFPGALEYHGGISKGKRKDAKDEFNYGTANLIIATQQSADTGLSLHDKKGDAPRCQINVTVPWTGMSMKQLAGRSYRLGSKSDVDMEWLFCDTPDEKKRAELVATRMKLLGASTSGIDVEESDELYKQLVEFMMGSGTGDLAPLTKALLYVLSLNRLDFSRLRDKVTD